MSFRVLVIPEDPTYNGYILKPLVERMLAEAGKPNARVMILTNPKLGGYEHAVQAIENELPGRYGHFDLWLFLPDADRASKASLKGLEEAISKRGIRLLCCAAVPEVEAWMLAGHRQNIKAPWTEVRNHHRLKEEVFEPFVRAQGDPRGVGGGREFLMRQTLSNYRGLLELCPELRDLEWRLKELLESENK